MGLKSWFSKKSKPAATLPPSTPAAKDGPLFPYNLAGGFGSAVEVSGTMTFAHPEVRNLVDGRGMTGERGYMEAVATLQPDPGNPVEKNVIEVIVDGFRVGCMFAGASKLIRERTMDSLNAHYQLHTLRDGGNVRAKAFVWLNTTYPDWKYTEQSPAPLTRDEKSKADEAGQQKIVRDGLKAGGERQKEFENALVGGVHYLELVEPIKQLKREGRLREALKLCYVAIESAEKDKSGGSPAPHYTTEAAIVHRKLKERDEEIAVLKRWLAASSKKHRDGSSIAERLAKLEAPKK